MKNPTILSASAISLLLFSSVFNLTPSFSEALEKEHHKQQKPISDEHQITHVMKVQFDRPDAPLKVHPVVIEDTFAVAGWYQGQKGGRALLIKTDGKWTISVCGGDGLREAKVLVQAGMSQDAARSLSFKIQAAEAKLTKAQLKQLSLFKGEIKVDPSKSHGHSNESSHHKGTHHGGQ